MLRRLAIHAPNSFEQGQAFQDFIQFNKYVRKLVSVLESLEKGGPNAKVSFRSILSKKQGVCVLGL